jgi:hypothetical protein
MPPTVRTDLRKPEPGSEDRRLFELNMIKLNDMLPAMMLTVDERLTLEDLVRSYFGKEPPPQLPWTRKDKAARRTNKQKGTSQHVIKEEKQ